MTVEMIERYLRVQLAGYHEPRPEQAGVLAVRPFVTISRQAGAGGHSLADALMAAFDAEEDRTLFGGWQVFDQRLCEIVANDPGLSKALDSLLAEEYRSTTADVLHTIVRSTPDQDYVMEQVFRVVRAVATVGKAIVVGRGGAQVTQGMKGRISLRVVGPEELRIPRVMEFYDLDERHARAHARKLDAARARLVKVHFDADIDDPAHYDAIWNTGSATVDEIAATVVALVRLRASMTTPVS